MKIQKNRSDAEMLKGFAEKETFETAVLPAEQKPPPPPAPLLSLPEDTLDKLDKAALKLRINWKNKGVEAVKWQVTEQEGKIILTALPKKPGG